MRSPMAPPARATTRSASSSSYYALAPDIKVIAPWREWDLTSRTRLLDYAEQHQIPIATDKRGEAPFSVDANLLHISAEGKVLEDPWVEPEEYRLQPHRRARDGARPAAICRDRLRARRPGRGRRRDAVAGGAADAAERDSAASTGSAGSISSRTALSA